MTSTAPLAHSRQRHTLLQQIHTHANTPLGWTRTRNPRKTDPASGLPDHLYSITDPSHRPPPPRQRAVRELDSHGLLHHTANGDHETLDLSDTGKQTLAGWNEAFGTPEERP